MSQKCTAACLDLWQVCGATGNFAMKDGSSKDVPIVSNPTKAVGKILVVDDDAAMRETLRDLLEAEGYAIVEAPDGVGMQACLEREAIDLITLDLRLGREDGLVLARDVRSHSNVPIIMISGRDETIDRVLGLSAGADDYIPKPFHAREVLARVRAVLRRYSASLTRVLVPRPRVDRTRSSRSMAGWWIWDGASFAHRLGRADCADGSGIRPSRRVCTAAAPGAEPRDHPRSLEGTCVVAARSHG